MFKGLYEHTLSIGSTGFAQVGQDNYWTRQTFEGKWLLNWFNTNFDFPPGCYIAWTSHPHDFGTYHELEVFYSEKMKTKVEINEMKEFVSSLEKVDIESLLPRVKNDWEIMKFYQAQKNNDGSHLKAVS